MSESYLILNVDPEEFTKLLSSDDVVIGRLFKRLLTHMEPRPSASVICLKSQSQLSDTSFEWSLTKHRLSSTLHAGVARLFELPKA